MIAELYRRGREQIVASSPLDLATILTTLLVAFHGFSVWFVRLPTQCLVVLGLIFRRLLTSPWFWLALAAFTGARIVALWQDVDNHKFILFYWLCCMALAHAVREQALQERVVVFNARFFLVFIMLGAVAQKLASPTYMDSSFFEYELLVDTRFRGFAALFGVDPKIPVQARELLELLRNPYVQVEGNAIQVETGPVLPALAVFVTWYDLLIQVVIGVAFLLCRRVCDLIGHIALLVFIFTVYFAAPVIGFAWTLIVFGIVLARASFPNIAMVYVLALVVTTLYKIPWAGWVV